MRIGYLAYCFVGGIFFDAVFGVKNKMSNYDFLQFLFLNVHFCKGFLSFCFMGCLCSEPESSIQLKNKNDKQPATIIPAINIPENRQIKKNYGEKLLFNTPRQLLDDDSTMETSDESSSLADLIVIRNPDS